MIIASCTKLSISRFGYDYTMHSIRQLALIGSTASGKTALAVKLAKARNAHILSIDSLAIYKEIDIVSAKPTVEEREGIVHFGIDHLFPNQPFSVMTFIRLYKDVCQRCLADQKELIIVGGTSFYLKMIMEGISELPPPSSDAIARTEENLQEIESAYAMLYRLDPKYASRIEKQDRYRIEKALNIYYTTGEKPSVYFASHPPKPVIDAPLPIYEIVWDRDILRQRITQRTTQMLAKGLIDEVAMLEAKYTRAPHCMKAIGVKETLAYLDGIFDKQILAQKIATNTARLAKRQNTFNRSQFPKVTRSDIQTLEKILI